MTEERIIKKYANRRLYDTSENKYIALDDIKQLVNQAIAFKVVEAKSDEDITRSILLQIIVEQEKNGDPILSTQLLEQIIRFYGDTLQSFVSKYLEKSFETFTNQQQTFHEQMDTLLKNTPQSIFTEITEKNLDLWQQMQNNFMQNYSNNPNKSNDSDKEDK